MADRLPKLVGSRALLVRAHALLCHMTMPRE